jgi:hypothetical protein
LSGPTGNYDYIEIIVTLISSNSLLKTYFINSSLPAYCQIGYSVNFTMLKISPFVVTMNNLCMLSSYNVDTNTYQNGFNTVGYSAKFQTSKKLDLKSRVPDIQNSYRFFFNFFSPYFLADYEYAILRKLFKTILN